MNHHYLVLKIWYKLKNRIGESNTCLITPITPDTFGGKYLCVKAINFQKKTFEKNNKKYYCKYGTYPERKI